MRHNPLRCGFLALWIPAALSGQAQLVRLGSPDSTRDEFSRIVALRELADGRVLVSDRRENQVAVVSFNSESARQVGRVGSGPGEYRRVGALIRMAADSTALTDLGAGRWLLLKADKPVSVVPPDNFAVRLTNIPIGITATHAYGFVLPPRGLGASAGDTMALVRVARGPAKVDTITLLAAPTARQSAGRSSNPHVTVVSISMSPWTAGEQALLFDDGWIAIARLDPYRVDWIEPGGRMRRGNSFRASDPPFTDAEKGFFLENLAKATGKPAEPITSRSDWPDAIPPFTSLFSTLGELSPALFHGVDGKLVIRRVVTAAEPEQRYDVIDRQSQLVAQIVMPAREVLIGIGKAHLYTARTDDDGIQRIRRYRWPVK